MNRMFLGSAACGLVALLFFSSVLDAQAVSKKWEPSGRRFTDIKKDVTTFSKRAAQADTDESRLHAVLDLCLLYFEIVSDKRYPTSKTLQGYTNRINYRLNETKRDIERDLRKLARNEVRPVPSGPPSAVDEEMQAVAIGVSDHLLLMAQANGGPQHVVDSAGGFFGGIMQANADDLIRLIESTIHPDSWENNGGVGTLRWWSQSMVLVVRATTEVHEDLERFLNMLRYSY